MSSKRLRPSMFLDLEAQEDKGESDGDDEEENLDDFLADEVDVESFTDDNFYQDFGQENDNEEEDIAAIVARAKERALQNSTASTSQMVVSDQDNLLKSLDASSDELWELRVKVGFFFISGSLALMSLKGRDAAALAKMINKQYQSLKKLPESSSTSIGPNQIPFTFEATCVRGLEGRIFVLTSDYPLAARTLSKYFADKTIFRNFVKVSTPLSWCRGITDAELDFLRQRPFSRGVERYQFVRFLKRGPGFNRGDVAVIILPEVKIRGHSNILLAVVPRFDQSHYLQTEMPASNHAQQHPSGPSPSKKRKRDILPAILHEAIYDHMRPSKFKNLGLRTYKNAYYKDGLQIVAWTCDDLHSLDLNPRLRNEDISLYANVQLTYQAVCNHLRLRESSWRRGDRIHVIQGEYIGTTGVINDVDFIKMTVSVVHLVLEGDEKVLAHDAVLEWHEVRRAFPVGTWIRVFYGYHKGRAGFITRESRESNIVEIWSPSERNEWGVEGRGAVEIEGAQFSVFQEFIEDGEAPSFAGLRHAFAPGTTEEIPGKKHAPSQPPNLQDAPAAYGLSHSAMDGRPFRHRLFDFGRLSSIGKPASQVDPRIGMYGMIVGGHAFKGFYGRIKNITTHDVIIETPGRYPPFCRVEPLHVVCFDDPSHTLAGTKLTTPVQLPPVATTPLPVRFATPEPDVGPSSGLDPLPIDPGECAFLIDPHVEKNWHCFVGFDIAFDRGNWVNRRGYTKQWPPVVSSDAGTDEIEVVVTDNHRGGSLVKKVVPIAQLKRTVPRKKGDDVVILKDGSSYGKTGSVSRCATKERTAYVKLHLADNTETYSFNDLCTISKSDLSIIL
ncbi:hypothetical protein H0H93_012526 [Arthromyces matolae]|nr:hypothetical protein H0H93_012526 [Arthromyces matolae]